MTHKSVQQSNDQDSSAPICENAGRSGLRAVPILIKSLPGIGSFIDRKAGSRKFREQVSGAQLSYYLYQFSIPLFIAIGFWLWSLAVSIILDRGTLWHLAGDDLVVYRNQDFQRQLFAFEENGARIAKGSIALIGSPDFCKLPASTISSASPNVLPLCLNYPSLQNVGQAIKIARQLGVGAIIIENDIRLWTNAAPNAYGPQQNIALWRRYKQRRKWKLYSRKDGALFSRTLKRILRSNGNLRPEKFKQNATLLNLEFRFPDVPTQAAYKQLVASVPKSFWKNIWWVASKTINGENANPALVADYERVMRAGAFVEKAGHFISDIADICVRQYNNDSNKIDGQGVVCHRELR